MNTPQMMIAMDQLSPNPGHHKPDWMKGSTKFATKRQKAETLQSSSCLVLLDIQKNMKFTRHSRLSSLG